MINKVKAIQFLRFCAVGFANTAVDFSVFSILTLGGVPDLIAQVLSYSAGVANSFFLNRKWTFQVQRKTSLSEVVKFVIVNALSLLVASGLLFILHDVRHLGLWLSKLIATGCGLVVNFLGSRLWVFTESQQSGDPNELKDSRSRVAIAEIDHKQGGLPMKSVLVTGGAGYIGSHTVMELEKQRYNVVVLDNLSTGHGAAVRSSQFFYIGDIADSELVREIIHRHQIDAVIHFAAKSLVSESVQKPELYFRENTIKTFSFFENVIREGVKHIVFSSTAAVYGSAHLEPIKETDSLHPVNPYGESKLMIEKYLHWVGKVHDVKWIALRYFNAAGASLDGRIGEDHQPESHLIPLVLQTALGQREYISIFGDDYPTADGTCIRDYIHVLDLAQAHILALRALYEGDIKQHVYNVGTGSGHSVKEIIDLAEQITGRAIKRRIDPRRAGDPPVLVADSRSLQEHLGWKPQYSDLHTIIQSAWEWHRTHPYGYDTAELVNEGLSGNYIKQVRGDC